MQIMFASEDEITWKSLWTIDLATTMTLQRCSRITPKGHAN
jgi:hypothetical protein